MVEKNRRSFTQAARLAAARSLRERNALRAANPHPLEVFVVRNGTRYAWEIRKFGAVLIEMGSETYVSALEAKDAGCAALEAHQAEPATTTVESPLELREPRRSLVHPGPQPARS